MFLVLYQVGIDGDGDEYGWESVCSYGIIM